MNDITPIEAAGPACELVAEKLLSELRGAETVAIFDTPENEDLTLGLRKDAADLLVKSKLAAFTDDTRTELSITNAGRYWALSGGYMAFLKEMPPAAGGGNGRSRNPEMETLRAEYMKLRLGTFWWSFGLSVAGFVLSIASVLIAIFYGDRLIR